MQISNYLKMAEQELAQAGIGTSRLDALVLLEDVTGRDRARLLAHPEFEISVRQMAKLEKLLTRRAAHEPLAYIRGKTEFYGREFVLTHDVLEPRPESETMIDVLKELFLALTKRHAELVSAPHPIEQMPKKQQFLDPRLCEDDKLQVAENQLDSSRRWNDKSAQTLRIADVGAGSGALGITAALELRNTQIELLEIDPKAAQVTQKNVDLFTLNISVIESDLLNASQQANDILLCNLPYVPDSHTINQAALHEPKLAIFGGADGLDIYRQLLEQVSQLKIKPLYILTECLPPQHNTLTTIMNQVDYHLAIESDFIQAFQLT